MKRPVIIGVMGAGEGASKADCEAALELGQAVARQGWVLLCGGRNEGVMEAVCRGMRMEDGISVGILPGDNHEGMCPDVTIPIVTGMGSARNNINVLSSDIIVVLGNNPGAGTISEAALAVKAQKRVMLLGHNQGLCDVLGEQLKSFADVNALMLGIQRLVTLLKGPDV